MNDKMKEVIQKWNIHIGYKGYEKGLMVDPEIDKEDLAYAKEHKAEIMAYLEEKEEREREERDERFKREYFEKEHSKEFEESRRTGEWVVYSKEMEHCNDPREECDWDWVVRYLKVTENGIETKQKRQHTW